MNPPSATPPGARPAAPRDWLRMCASLVFFMAVWLVWSGYLKPLLVGLGLLSCCLVILLSTRMGDLEEETGWLGVLPRLPAYWLWLAREVVVSNFTVARIILSPRLALDPVMVTLEADVQDPFGQAVLGNSITLTPGTLTVGIDAGRLRVHCLTHAGAEELLRGEMNRRIAALTRR